jgi:hypothetical protein
MEKLKLGDARVSASALSVVNNIEGQEPEQEPGQQPQSHFRLESPFSVSGASNYVSTHGMAVARSKGNVDSRD